jgi:hypothetical protein
VTAVACTLGRHLDAADRHDPRSRAFPAATAPLTTVLHEHHGPVLDQGRVLGRLLRQGGDCTVIHTEGS